MLMSTAGPYTSKDQSYDLTINPVLKCKQFIWLSDGQPAAVSTCEIYVVCPLESYFGKFLKLSCLGAIICRLLF